MTRAGPADEEGDGALVLLALPLAAVVGRGVSVGVRVPLRDPVAAGVSVGEGVPVPVRVRDAAADLLPVDDKDDGAVACTLADGKSGDEVSLALALPLPLMLPVVLALALRDTDAESDGDGDVVVTSQSCTLRLLFPFLVWLRVAAGEALADREREALLDGSAAGGDVGTA